MASRSTGVGSFSSTGTPSGPSFDFDRSPLGPKARGILLPNDKDEQQSTDCSEQRRNRMSSCSSSYSDHGSDEESGTKQQPNYLSYNLLEGVKDEAVAGAAAVVDAENDVAAGAASSIQDTTFVNDDLPDKANDDLTNDNNFANETKRDVAALLPEGHPKRASAMNESIEKNDEGDISEQIVVPEAEAPELLLPEVLTTPVANNMVKKEVSTSLIGNSNSVASLLKAEPTQPAKVLYNAARQKNEEGKIGRHTKKLGRKSGNSQWIRREEKKKNWRQSNEQEEWRQRPQATSATATTTNWRVNQKMPETTLQRWNEQMSLLWGNNINGPSRETIDTLVALMRNDNSVGPPPGLTVPISSDWASRLTLSPGVLESKVDEIVDLLLRD